MTQHAERRVLSHSPEHLYELVADVAKYPEFLPWCLASRIRTRDEEVLIADLIIGFQVFKERFTSHVRLDPEAMEIHVEYAEGPFKYLTNRWPSCHMSRAVKLIFMSILNLIHVFYKP